MTIKQGSIGRIDYLNKTRRDCLIGRNIKRKYDARYRGE